MVASSDRSYHAGFSGTRTKEILNISPEEREQIYSVRQSIFNSLNPDKTPNSQVPTSSLGNIPNSGDFNAQINVFSKFIYMRESSKRMKLMVYREMSKYPYIHFAVNEYVNEAIHFDKNDKFMSLNIKNEVIKNDDIMRKTILSEFDNLFYNVLEADDNVTKWFREFMIDGEIFFEKLIDNNKDSVGIIGLKRLSSLKTFASFDETLDNSKVDFFVYKSLDGDAKNFSREHIAYANSGLFEETQEGTDIEPLSFLESGKITYRKLKLLEDSLVIYRLVRAPERRVFNVDVGLLAKGKADQYLRDTIIKHRQKQFFDPSTGDLTEDVDVMALTEDYYFPKFAGGRGTTVDTIQGGDGLKDMKDVEYFRDMLYKGFGVPAARFGEDAKVTFGNNDDVSREEFKFVQEVARFTKKFSKMFMDIFITHLKLRGLWKEYGLRKNFFKVKITNNNLFEKLLEAKQLKMRFENFGLFKDMLTTTEKVFSTEWACKKFLEITEDEWNQNVMQASLEKAGDKAGEEGGSDFSGDSMGMDETSDLSSGDSDDFSLDASDGEAGGDEMDEGEEESSEE